MATTFRNRVNKPLGVATLSAGINSSVLTITLTTGTGAVENGNDVLLSTVIP